MYCFIPLINRPQNYLLKLCLKYVLLTRMSDALTISSVTHMACLYAAKRFSVENSNGIINGKLDISHLSSEPRCRDQGNEARELWKEKEHDKDLRSIHMVAVGSGQGQTFSRRRGLDRPCVHRCHAEPVNQMQAQR